MDAKTFQRSVLSADIAANLAAVKSHADAFETYIRLLSWPSPGKYYGPSTIYKDDDGIVRIRSDAND